MNYFNEYGRRIPRASDRVFGQEPRFYYQIEKPIIDYQEVLQRSKKHGVAPESLEVADFEKILNKLLLQIRNNADYANLLKGVHVPFVYINKNNMDLGAELEDKLLPGVQNSFADRFPDAHFKAILQSNSKLKNSISISSFSRYETFMQLSQNAGVVGLYFPQAMQEFDIDSQRTQMQDLPIFSSAEVCLSGGKDVCASLIGNPELLISKDYYAPILCMSSYVHTDPRLALLMKSYGPHLEFWCMTQMLTKNIKQVSEQWAGGITIYVTL